MQQLTGEDVIRSQFVTLIDAENFYSKYSKVMGFNIRKNDIQYDNDGETYVRRWVCKREGERAKKYIKRKDRIRELRVTMRVKHPVAFRVRMNKKLGTWFVIPEHLHELVKD
ncbi:hypothetical protein WN944_014518 [Citrus x changshan-huyou]|uniref:FAR1 domain-containing protein n=1 Tax=Citrus x changshan-huyou TaxID=2935761 RepID=A0AAP0M5R4_9ROSI